jgi:protein ImuB
VVLDDPVELFDADDKPVRVTGRGLFSAAPSRLSAPGRNGELAWWAGPWPVDERWWDPEQSKAGRTARAQVLLGGDGGKALLLCYRQRRWYVEGIYE